MENPREYAPAYGGYCAWAMAKGDRAPIVPEMWAVRDGTLYLNYNRRTQKEWSNNPDEFIDNADKHWPGVRKELLSEK